MKNQTQIKSDSIIIRKSYLLLILSLFIIIGKAQTKSNDIVGIYQVPSKDGAIRIYESNGKYYGKIILNKDSTKLDINNPDKSKQKLRILGSNILNEFKFDGDDTWENGTIYDPKNGKTYNCEITRSANGDLNIRGYIGISLFGRTEVFAKLKK